MSDLNDDNLYWVGIGASAGGLEAIKQLVQALPANANFVYVVAQHLSPKHTSMMSELVQRGTPIKVKTIEHDCVVEANTIYITPPKQDVTVSGHKLQLSLVEEETIPKPSINNLFLSLAEEKKDHAVGIILSGTGSDGAHGIKNIRAMGGLTIAQEPTSADYDGMPISSIQTDCVDLVLNPKEIGDHLCKLAEKLPAAYRVKLERAEVRDHFGELMNLVRSHCGVSFKQYKKATLQRRIERRMLACNSATFEQYVELCKQQPDEIVSLFKDILISVTDFFRDLPQFENFEQIIRKVVAEKGEGQPLRFWSVGCATGEEAYSLAMLVAEAFDSIGNINDANIQVFATDVDNNALAIARRGIYDQASMVNVPERLLKKYFIKHKKTYEVIKPIKDMMLFASHNVIEDPPFLRVDIITCRNLLIYFETELQKKIYKVFHYALKPKGYLFLGKSESVTHASSLFYPVNSKSKLFQRRAAHASGYSHLSFTTAGRRMPQPAMPPQIEKSPVPELNESLVKQLGKSAVLVNDALNIEHVYGDASPFLSFANGKPELNLSTMINEVYRQEVRALAFKALREDSAIYGQTRKIKIEGKLHESRLRVIPLGEPDDNERFSLIVFEVLARVKKATAANKGPEDSQRVRELESELSAAREHLQTVIEELETSNEELQSLNEELQSSNEELQSSNEELETTNEELQSANEELVTMNDELNNKTVALEQATTQLVNIKNSLDFPLIVIDENYNITRSNIVARRRFELVDGKLQLELLTSKPGEQSRLRELIDKTLSEGESQQCQMQEGSRHTWVHINPYRNRDESISGAILSLVDNSQLMQHKQELIESRERAQIANVAKTEFLANVSHEIRTPLNAIYGVSEILNIQLSDELKQKTHFEVLDNCINSLKDLLNDLLDFAKLESGKLPLEIADFSLRAVARKVVDNYRLQAEKKGLTISCTVEEGLQDVYKGDALRLHQILSNLVSNAIKFTDSGQVRLLVESGRGKAGNLRFCVIDTGIGIKASDLENIFEKFSQSDASITRRYGGTGLGLAIVKELASLMGGDIGVNSEYGAGSTFTFEVFLEAGSFDLTTTTSSASLSKIFTDSECASANRILVVDDQHSNLVVMASFLDYLGCAYDLAESGHDAIHCCRQHNYACILLDLHMEGLDGFSTLRQIRDVEQQLGYEPAQVVAVSGDVQNDVIDKSRLVGMKEFLQKPLDFKGLQKVLKNILVEEKCNEGQPSG